MDQLKEDTITKLTGKVIDIQQTEKLTRIKLQHQCTSNIIIFENLSIQKDQTIQVKGKIDTYNGEKQLIAEKIENENIY